MPNTEIRFNNVDPVFFKRNGLSQTDFEDMLRDLPVPWEVTTIVVDGNTTGRQYGRTKNTSHPMVYALADEGNKLRIFRSSKGRAARNTGAKRVLIALRTDKLSDVLLEV